jgi:broad specificity phosphatase PhoE
MSILIVRHAETVHNAARVMQGPDSVLSELGRSQASRLAARLTQHPIRRILASDYQRAFETAGYISARSGISVEPEPLLRERDFGDLRGVAYREIGFDAFAADYVPPNGEGWPAFFERVARAWEKVTRAATETDGDLLVVTHGLVCQALADRHLSCQASGPASLSMNSALTEVDSTPPWTVRRLNCAAHLQNPSAVS